MSRISSYILSTYSFLESYPLGKLLEVGHKLKGTPIPSFDEDTLIELCSEVQIIFQKEQNLLELEGNYIIVGDIHGSLHDVLRILNYAKENPSKILFIGDYVDRCSFSLECVTLLFAIKVTYPDSVFLIRGNHEFDEICSKYGFKDQILNTCQFNHHSKNEHKKVDNLQFDQDLPYLSGIGKSSCHKYTESLYDAFIQVFSYMPIAALINRTTFCIHGGLCPELNYIKDIKNKIKRPINRFDECKLLKSLLWSDPSSNPINLYIENQRGIGYQFNFESVNFFLAKNSLKRIIRGHQFVSHGYHSDFHGKCITVFSASSYNADMGNYSGIVKLNQKSDKIEYVNFFPIQRINKEDVYYYKVNSYYSKGDEIKLKCYSVAHPLMTFKSNVYNSSIKFIPQKKIFREKSSKVIHLARYPIHYNPRTSNPLIKFSKLLEGHTQNSIIACSDSSSNDNLANENCCINHHPIMDLSQIQEEV